ncbi:MAG: hypothetical protein Q4Q04_06635 [Methanocorpusculum sp.]|nr:hypothetical protein [Methanocorpusculum sp.]
MDNTTLSGIIALAIFAGVIVLEVYLSKKPSRIPGLILPIISFCFALLGTAVVFVVLMLVPSPDVAAPPLSELVVPVLLPFAVWNFPTAILLIVYGICRKVMTAKNQVEKMCLQDIE